MPPGKGRSQGLVSLSVKLLFWGLRGASLRGGLTMHVRVFRHTIRRPANTRVAFCVPRLSAACLAQAFVGRIRADELALKQGTRETPVAARNYFISATIILPSID